MGAACIRSAALRVWMGWVGQYTAAVYRVEVEQVDKLHMRLQSASTAQPKCEFSEYLAPVH